MTFSKRYASTGMAFLFVCNSAETHAAQLGSVLLFGVDLVAFWLIFDLVNKNKKLISVSGVSYSRRRKRKKKMDQ